MTANRRDFLAMLGGALAAKATSARSQSASRIRRVGILMGYTDSDQEAHIRVDAFIDGMRRADWIEGKTMQTSFHWAGNDPASIRSHAVALVREEPDVILASTTPVVRELLRETRKIPIVFLSVSDPVGDRFVASLARPEGNATGFTNLIASLGGKWVELLKEINAPLVKVAALFNPDVAANKGGYYYGPFQNAANALSVAPVSMAVRNERELEAGIAALAPDGPGTGLVVMPDAFTVGKRAGIIALAGRHRITAIYPYAYFALEGGLIAYGVDLVDQYRAAVSYVDRILEGEKVATLPVQAPTRFELVINLRTAKALGLSVPPSLQLRADKLIQ
jgi:putative tryptophan/tyrosine transport system substrate-binding protein